MIDLRYLDGKGGVAQNSVGICLCRRVSNEFGEEWVGQGRTGGILTTEQGVPSDIES